MSRHICLVFQPGSLSVERGSDQLETSVLHVRVGTRVSSPAGHSIVR